MIIGGLKAKTNKIRHQPMLFFKIFLKKGNKRMVFIMDVLMEKQMQNKETDRFQEG